MATVVFALTAACGSADNALTPEPISTNSESLPAGSAAGNTTLTTTEQSPPDPVTLPSPTLSTVTDLAEDQSPSNPVPVASSTSSTMPVTTVTPTPVCLDRLSTREKSALLVWPSVYADDWDTARTVVRDVGVGGVLLMRPRLTETELTARVSELDALSSLGMLVAVDEEGGDVQRLRDIQPFPSQYDISTTFSPTEAREQVARHAQLVARVGVDFVFGPVVDVLPEQGEPPLQKSRFFNGGPEAVGSYGAAYVDGWDAAGLTAVLKHFPGHGSASGDTHLEAGLTPGLDALEVRDLVPYRQLAGRADAVMVGHLTVPGLTGDRPATTSPEAISYLRTTLGYSEALVISDSLDMTAAGGSVPAVAVESIAAGIDVVLFTVPSQAGAVVDAITAAVERGDVPATRLDDAAGRVLRHVEARGGGCD